MTLGFWLYFVSEMSTEAVTRTSLEDFGPFPMFISSKKLDFQAGFVPTSAE